MQGTDQVPIMQLLSKSKTNTVVGLDIEAGSVAATEVSSNGSAQVTGFGITPLDPGICRDGEVADPEELGKALKELFTQHKLSRSVRIGVASQRVAVRSLRLPLIEDHNELETAIRFQAQDHIPMPLEQAVLDWQVVGRVRHAEGGGGHVDVVIVAGRRDMLTAVMGGARAAGLRPVGIDISAFGMVRALADSPQGAAYPDIAGNPAAEVAQATLFCNIGDVMNLAVARGSTCLFTRIASFGIEGMAQRLAERKQLKLEHARQWLPHVGLDVDPTTVEGDPEMVAATREVLAEGASRLADELRLSLEGYGAQEAAAPVDEVVAAGSGTTIPGLVPALQDKLGLPFRVGRPLPLGHLDEQTAARLTLSYGLALEEN
jgi:type IV pilus assembly protein PilM